MDKNIVDDLCTISAVHSDILHSYILTRLDGPSLASVGAASFELRALSSSDSLWRDTCHRAWPATAHPCLRHVISAFPSGHRSFFADCHSTLHHRHLSPAQGRPKGWVVPGSTLISAVDIHYKNKNHLFSKVVETDVSACSWSGSQFLVELLSPKERLNIPGKLDIKNPTCESELEANLSLSWILIDPTQTRAANMTNGRPVSVYRDWSTRNVEVRFGTILSGEINGDLVECALVVTCGGWDNEDLHVKQVRLEIEDVKGNKLKWREGFVILQEAIRNGERRKGGERGGYEEFSEMKESRGRKLRGERWRDDFAICIGVVVMVGFWGFTTFRFFRLLCSYFISCVFLVGGEYLLS